MSFRFANRFARSGAGAKSTRRLDAEATQGESDIEDVQSVSGDAEAEKGNNKVLPMEKRASWLSRRFFLWFLPVLQQGYKYDLKPSSIESVEPVDEPYLLYQTFVKYWDAEVQHAGEKRPNMIKVMLQTVGYKQLSLGLLLSCVQGACLSSVPFVSRQLLELLSSESANVGQQQGSSSEKAWLAVGLVLLPLIAALAQAELTYISRRGSMHLFIVFTQAIFNKSLRLSSASRNSSSSGQLVNLIATDAGTALERAVLLIYPLFLAPPLLAVLLYLVSLEVGISLLAGFACMVVAMPANVSIFMGLTKVYGRTIALADDRIKLVNEALQAIRVLKMYAWEVPFIAKIRAMRERELVFLRKHAFLFAVGLNAVYLQLPYLIQFCTFATYYLTGNPFYPWVIFTAIQLFAQIQQQLTQLPSAISQLSQSTVAARRITDFLLLSELEENSPLQGLDGSVAVRMDHSSFTWDVAVGSESGQGEDENGVDKNSKQAAPKTRRRLWRPPRKQDSSAGQSEGAASGSFMLDKGESPLQDEDLRALKSLDLEINIGQRVAVIGRVASGKSSLLLSITGELRRCEGSSLVNGSLAYTAQTPFIQSCSVRENILFGKSFSRKLYDDVLEACCLIPDLEIMPQGDQTFIGERGINLSGGQKSRIALARAVYAQADITLLDDPLSAVDAHVGATIMSECIFGPLFKGRTLIFTTNKLERLDEFDKVVLLSSGSVEQQGKWGKDVVVGEQDLADESDGKTKGAADEPGGSSNSSSTEKGHDGSRISEGGVEIEEKGVDAAVNAEDSLDHKADKLYEEEEEASGTLKFSVLRYFIQSIGPWLFGTAYGLYILYLFTPLFAQYTLTWWTDEQLCEEFQDPSCELRGQDFFFRIYCALVLGGLVVCVIAGFFIAEARVVGSRSLHNQLVGTAFKASITDFFDVNPMGRVLNKFAKDMSIVDFPLSQMGMFAVVVFAYSLSAFIGVALGTNGLFAIAMLPIAILYILLYSYTRTTAVKLQRLEARARSPIYSNFSEVLNGLKTIRGFAQQEAFVLKNRSSLTRNVESYFLARVALPAAQMVMVNAIGSLIMVCVICFVLLTDQIAPGQAGLAITYALQISQTMNALVFVFTDFEISMNSVERIKQFVEDVKPEDPMEQSSDAVGTQTAENIQSGLELRKVIVQPDLSPEWPADGKIEVSNLVVGYRKGPNVLHSVSLSIRPAEKVGVCGRTGSGKSSLLNALLRIVEPREGSIVVDGIDISTLSLRDLRSRIAIIPQTPVVFQETLRFNLDPLQLYSDDQLNETLTLVNLAQFVDNLDMELVEGGDNVSEGQRQLICFVRAILRKSRILMLDESTAMTDRETDAHLQRLVRDVFADRTVITIAHRLESILSSDRILVMDQGHVAELDTPQALLANPGSAFASMMQAEKNSASS